MKKPHDHARALLAKASNDLDASKAILAAGCAFDMGCFHAQQAVEKSLKALLASADEEYPLRHDLGELVERVRTRFSGLGLPMEKILELAPYAVEVRYDEEFYPGREEAQKALITAQEVYKKVVAFLPSVERR